ncbi:hypothetical protein [uncultured Jannaschia sp.]|nr:hypothetical protein [uncultured Jannaschia sp.]
MLDMRPGMLGSAAIGVPHFGFGKTPVGGLVPEREARPDLA